jgi:hypothetical protein
MKLQKLSTNKINIKKATGKDGISSKILKLSESEVSYPISKLGLIVGQKTLLFGPPTHLSMK